MIEELTCTLIEDHDEVLVGDTQTPILEFLAPDDLPLHEHIASKKIPLKKEYQWADWCESSDSSEASSVGQPPDLMDDDNDLCDDDTYEGSVTVGQTPDLMDDDDDESCDDDTYVNIGDYETLDPAIISSAVTEEEIKTLMYPKDIEGLRIAMKSEEFCLASYDTDLDDSLMIADTGATVHMRRNTDGMFDIREEKCIVRYGNGAHSTSTTVGKWAGMIDQDGEKKKVILDGVTVVPGSAYNLFSLTRTLNKGILSSEGEIMILQCKGMN